MKNILLLLAAVALVLLPSPTHAGGKGAAATNPNSNNNNGGNNSNSSTQDPTTNPRMWQAKFSNGFYMVRLDRLCSVSKQEYIANGSARVVEVDIADQSNAVARFYFLEPVGKDSSIAAAQTALDRAQSTLQDAASKVSPTIGQLHVVKDYPTSTHAHTIEYVVQSEDTLNSLFASIQNAFNLGQGAVWVSPDQ